MAHKLISYKDIENYNKFGNFTIAKCKVLKEQNKLQEFFENVLYTRQYLQNVFATTVSTGLFKQRISCLINYAQRVYRIAGEVLYS